MKPITILFLQALLTTLQMINAGLATIPNMPIAMPLVVAAVVGGFQVFVQNIGNLATPPDKIMTKVVTAVDVPATSTTPAATVQTTTVKTEPMKEIPTGAV
jgi:hypothetical protein